MEIFLGQAENLKRSSAFEDIGIYRRRVFVERLGWDLALKDELELDQFDRADTVYIGARDEFGALVGCARLLPTSEPYLLGEVFPQLLNGLPPPSSAEVWEISRFAAIDLNGQPTFDNGQFSESVSATLLRTAVQFAKEQGAKHLISVSPIGVERLIRKTGFHARRAGPPMIVNGHPIFACWIDFDANDEDESSIVNSASPIRFRN